MPLAGKPRRKKSSKKRSELDSALDQVTDESVAASMKEFQDLLAQAKGDTGSARTLHDFTQPIVRERLDATIVAASHRVVIN
jgi:hypothetical protein